MDKLDEEFSLVDPSYCFCLNYVVDAVVEFDLMTYFSLLCVMNTFKLYNLKWIKPPQSISFYLVRAHFELNYIIRTNQLLCFRLCNLKHAQTMDNCLVNEVWSVTCLSHPIWWFDTCH